MSSSERARGGFSIFGFPVRVSPFFLFIIVALGMPDREQFDQRFFLEIGIWVAVVFVSILWHELGHAFAMRRYGYSPEIELYGMGGRTFWGRGPATEPTAGQRVLVSVAGPFAGFALGALVFAVHLFVVPTGQWALDWTLWLLLWANIAWGALNLLPMLPWDGGHALEGVLDRLTGGRGRAPTAVVTIVVALGAAAAAWFLLHSLWAVFLCALSVATGVRALRQPSPRTETQSTEERPTEQRAVATPDEGASPAEHLRHVERILGDLGAPDRLAAVIATRRELSHAAELARRLEDEVAPACRAPSQRAKALELAGWASLLASEPDAAHRCAQAMRPSYEPSPLLEALVALRRDRMDDVEAILRTEQGGPLEEARPLLETFVAASGGEVDRAIERVGGDRGLGATVDAALFVAGRFDEAARFAELLFERFSEPEDAYNAACSHARAGREAEALRWLERAVDAGYRDLEHLEADEDLQEVRRLPAYRAWRAALER